jgi:hypothetical protein
MENFNITGDGRYVQMLGRIVDLHTDISTDIDSPNPIFVCEMYKNQFAFAYKENLFESTDLFKKMKQLIYPMMGNNSGYIMEYEVRYGNNLIFESEDKFRTEQIILESWDFVKNKLYEQCPIIIEGYWDDFKSGVGKAWDKTKEVAGKAWDKTKEVAGKAWEGIKDAGTWIINKGLPWFFQTLEDFLMSPVGIGLDVALTAIGVGKVATGVLWGAILVWKIYKLVTGKSDAKSWLTYVDIAICIVGIGFSGAAKGLRVAVNAAGKNAAKLGAKVLGPILNVISKGAKGAMNLMVKPLEWLAKSLGPKATNLITTFKNSFNRVFDDMSKAISGIANSQTQSVGSVIKKGITQDIITPGAAALAGKGPVSIAAAARKGALAGTAFYGAQKGLEKANEKYGDKIRGTLGIKPDEVDIDLNNATFDFETSL